MEPPLLPFYIQDIQSNENKRTADEENRKKWNWFLSIAIVLVCVCGIGGLVYGLKSSLNGTSNETINVLSTPETIQGSPVSITNEIYTTAVPSTMGMSQDTPKIVKQSFSARLYDIVIQHSCIKLKT